jgi:hypothetical protein
MTRPERLAACKALVLLVAFTTLVVVTVQYLSLLVDMFYFLLFVGCLTYLIILFIFFEIVKLNLKIFLQHILQGLPNLKLFLHEFLLGSMVCQRSLLFLREEYDFQSDKLNRQKEYQLAYLFYHYPQ